MFDSSKILRIHRLETEIVSHERTAMRSEAEITSSIQIFRSRGFQNEARPCSTPDTADARLRETLVLSSDTDALIFGRLANLGAKRDCESLVLTSLTDLNLSSN